MIYYITIPCYVTEGRPESALTPNRRCNVKVEAESPHKAIEKLSVALTVLFQACFEEDDECPTD